MSGYILTFLIKELFPLNCMKLCMTIFLYTRINEKSFIRSLSWFISLNRDEHWYKWPESKQREEPVKLTCQRNLNHKTARIFKYLQISFGNTSFFHSKLQVLHPPVWTTILVFIFCTLGLLQEYFTLIFSRRFYPKRLMETAIIR